MLGREENESSQKNRKERKMYTKMLLLLLLPISLLASVSSAQVNGYLQMVEDIPVLHLWGSNNEMGYAYGYIMGPDIVKLFENELIPEFGGPVTYEIVRASFIDDFVIPTRFQQIAEGMIDGIDENPECTLYSELLGRNFDPYDLHIGNSTHDINAIFDLNIDRMACTSISSWGNATITDSQLQGGAAMARNLDWSSSSVIASHGLLIVYSPDDGNNWVSITFTGYIGCMSGMNEYGIVAECNISNYENVSTSTIEFVPVYYRMAAGLVEPDYDGSGSYDLGDFVAAATDTTLNNAVSQVWHAICPEGLEYNGERGVVVEIHNEEGFDVRVASDDPNLTPEHLVATNHHRNLYPPIYCSRYSLLTDSIQADPNMNLERLWTFMGCCSAARYTWQTMIFDVENLVLGLAFADSISESCEKDPVWFAWDDLLGIESIEPITPMELSVCPNPFSSSVVVTVGLIGSGSVIIQVFDLSGRMVEQVFKSMLEEGNQTIELDASEWHPGIYLIQLNSGNTITTQKSVLIR